MLKKRSSAVCSKQGLMSDHIPFPSPTTKFRNRTTGSSLIQETDQASVMSPTSILEAKPFCAAGNHNFFSGRKPKADSNNSTEAKIHPWDVTNSQNVGLGILNALSNEKSDKKSSKAETRMVLFGSQLKVQIPSTSQNVNPVFSSGSVISPHSLIEFGVKNKNSKLAMSLLSPQRKSFGTSALCISPSEMELSEDYTRVVSHGPNPRTVHIFDNCTLRREMKFSMDDDFLAFCQFCRKKLGQGKDIFMYRGEKAFCSHECRSREMLLDDETEN